MAGDSSSPNFDVTRCAYVGFHPQLGRPRRWGARRLNIQLRAIGKGRGTTGLASELPT